MLTITCVCVVCNYKPVLNLRNVLMTISSVNPIHTYMYNHSKALKGNIGM